VELDLFAELEPDLVSGDWEDPGAGACGVLWGVLGALAVGPLDPLGVEPLAGAAEEAPDGEAVVWGDAGALVWPAATSGASASTADRARLTRAGRAARLKLNKSNWKVDCKLLFNMVMGGGSRTAASTHRHTNGGTRGR
jgi:hypothetical protein